MLVNDERSSYYNNVGGFYQFGIGENPAPECMVNGTECYDG